MKTTNLRSGPLWILLLGLTTSKVCGQLTAGTKQSDSLAVATDFIKNAKSIHQDLIKGDWAIQREVVYKSQIQQQETTIAQQGAENKTLKTVNGQLSGELASTRQALGEQVLKTKAARLEIWAMRVAVALYVAAKVKGVLP